MHEYYDLFAHFKDSDQILKDNLIHYVVPSLDIPHFFDSIECALQRRWSVARVKRENTLAVSAYEVTDVFVVRQSGRETDQPDRFLHLDASR